MPFLQTRPAEARTPEVEVLPDGRMRLTRFFRLTQTGEVPYGLTTDPGTADPWPETAPTGFAGLVLTYKKLSDESVRYLQGGKDPIPWVELTYEQIAVTGETSVGGMDQSELTDGRVQVVDTAVQFSFNAFVPQVINVSAVSGSQGTTCYLFLEETDNDGTLINIKRTYQSAGTVSTDDESLQGGALLTKKITSFHTVPSTPSGYTRVGMPVQNPNGYPIYTYSFAKGAGLVMDELETVSQAALITYHRIALGTAPTTPSATIGGTVTLFETNIIQEDGYVKYDYRWAEGDGQNSITTEGHQDGALDYTVTTSTLAASTPSYPGSGTGYLVQLTQTAQDAYFRNVAIYRKAPATVAFRKTMDFQMPGLAYLSGTQLILSPPVNMQILTTVTVSYSTSQTTTAPFSITAPASFYDSYVPYLNPGTSPVGGTPPADTSTAAVQSSQRGLGGYVAASASSGGTNNYYAGAFCQTYAYTLVNSTPNARPTGATTIRVDNDDYIFDLAGTKVFRVTVVTYTF